MPAVITEEPTFTNNSSVNITDLINGTNSTFLVPSNHSSGLDNATLDGGFVVTNSTNTTLSGNNSFTNISVPMGGGRNISGNSSDTSPQTNRETSDLDKGLIAGGAGLMLLLFTMGAYFFKGCWQRKPCAASKVHAGTIRIEDLDEKREVEMVEAKIEEILPSGRVEHQDAINPHASVSHVDRLKAMREQNAMREEDINRLSL